MLSDPRDNISSLVERLNQVRPLPRTEGSFSESVPSTFR